MYKRFLGAALATVCWAFSLTSSAADDPVVRVGVLKFGTVNWELKALKNAGFDRANGFELEVVPFAGGDATKIALHGGEVDIIVSDWLWVSRQRADDITLSFVPYSSSVGALMVPADSDIHSLADLVGKKIGVTGGPIDKSWLLLQGLAKQEHAIDIAAENDIVFGAPPLLAEKTRDGELDATLNYWHYCARLEADGFRRVVSVEDATMALGASGPISSLGYVFNEAWAQDNPAVAGFIKAIRETKQLLLESDDEWQRLASSGAIKDGPEALAVLRDRFREGIPKRALSDEIRDAEVIYEILENLGGKKLVGDSKVLVKGTYWEGVGS
jgi:NitT/TauT family transport system substrate-binding protein